jgi:hypothetical protein
VIVIGTHDRGAVVGAAVVGAAVVGAAVVGAAVVGAAVVGAGRVVVVVVVESCTSTENVAESVRTSPSLSVILAVMVCPPAVGDHGLALPSVAVPLKSKGRELSRLCSEPSSSKATWVIVRLDGTKI